MFEVYREAPGGGIQPSDDAEPTAGTDIVPAAEGEAAAPRWRWQLTLGDKVLATSADSWTKRSAAIAAVQKLRTIVASAGVVEKLA